MYVQPLAAFISHRFLEILLFLFFFFGGGGGVSTPQQETASIIGEPFNVYCFQERSLYLWPKSRITFSIVLQFSYFLLHKVK